MRAIRGLGVYVKLDSVTVKLKGRRWVLSVEWQFALADQTHPSDTIVAGDFGVVRRVTFSDGVVVPAIDVSWEQSGKVLPAWAQERAQVQPELEKVAPKISKLEQPISGSKNPG